MKGGKREGSGRKPISPTGEAMKARQVRMTDEEWQKVKDMGGASWLRQVINLLYKRPS